MVNSTEAIRKGLSKRVQFKGGPAVAGPYRGYRVLTGLPLGGSLGDILHDGIRMQDEVLAVRTESLPKVDAQMGDGIRAGFFCDHMQYGRVFHSSELQNHPNVVISPTGQYDIIVLDSRTDKATRTTIRTTELPTDEVNNASKYRGAKLLENLYFVSVNNDELPVYFYWDAPPANAPLPKWKFAANHIDAAFAQKAREKAAALAKDVNQKLRRIPDIKPDSRDWINAEERFTQVFNDAKRGRLNLRFDEIIKAAFNEEQLLLLEVDFDNESHRRKLQDRNTLIYRELMQTVFVTKNSNAVTKCTMVHFGLPIEPLTIMNIRNAGSAEADPEDLDPFGQEAEAVRFQPRALEFLDEFDDRGYGYPMLRRAKSSQPYKTDPDDPFIKRTRERIANVRPSGSAPRRPQKKCGAPGFSTVSDYIPSIRGGAGEPLGHRKGPFELHTPHGVYFFRDLPSDSKSSIAAKDEFISILEKPFPDGGIAKMEFSSSHTIAMVVLSNETTSGYYNKYVRKTIRDPKESSATISLQNVPIPPIPDAEHNVKLHLESVGWTYWRLPSLASNRQSIKAYEMGFRTAMEYLEPNHSSRNIKWTVGGYTEQSSSESGYLNLAGEVPSSALCNSVIHALASKKTNGAWVTVTVQLLEQALDHVPKLLLMPGVLEVKNCTSSDRQAMKSIRDFVNEQCGKPTQIRLWKNILHYNAGNMAALTTLPLDSKDDQRTWTDADLLVEPVLIFRPEFEEFRIIVNNQARTKADVATWRANEWTLKSFREVVSRFLDPKKPEFTILRSKSSEQFQIGSDMTEDEWRLDVFDWFLDNEIVIERGLIGERGGLGRQPVPDRATAAVSVRRTEEVTQGTESSEPQNLSPRNISNTNDTLQDLDDTWQREMTEQHRQDSIRRNAWITNQSVHNETGEPSIPLYGPARELSIRSGPSFPIVFTNTLTPSTVSGLLQENLCLENAIIGRQSQCPICKEIFEPGRLHDEEFRAHLERHRRALDECSLCHMRGWSKFTTEEKVQHIRGCVGQESPGSQNHEHFCSYCGQDLNEFGTEDDLLRHLIDDPGCESNGASPDRFCGYCGLDLRTIRSSGARQAHRFECAKMDKPPQEAAEKLPPAGSAKMCQYPGCSINLSRLVGQKVRWHFAQHVLDACILNGTSVGPGGLTREDIEQYMSNVPKIAKNITKDATNKNLGPVGKALNKVPKENADKTHAEPAGKPEHRIPEKWKAHIDLATENIHCPICLEKVNKAVLTKHRHAAGCNVQDDRQWIVCKAEELRRLREAKLKGDDGYKTMGKTLAQHETAWRAANPEKSATQGLAAAKTAAKKKAEAQKKDQEKTMKKDTLIPRKNLKEPPREKTPDEDTLHIVEETAPTSDVAKRIKERRDKEKAESLSAQKVKKALGAAKKDAVDTGATKKAADEAAKKKIADEAVKKKSAGEAAKKRAANEAAKAGEKRPADDAGEGGPAPKKAKPK